MLIVHRKRWFKGFAVVTAAATLWLSVEGTANAAPTSRAGRARVEDVAARLGVDAASLAGPDSSAEATRVADRRAHALERLAQRTGRDRQAPEVAKVAKVAAEIRRAHLPSLLGGIAQAADAARAVAAKRVSGNVAGQRVAAQRLKSIADAIDHGARRAGSSGLLDARLSAALSSARQLARAARAAAAENGAGAAREVERLAPTRHASALDVRDRRPMQLRLLAPPRPRARVQLGAVPTAEQRALYAALLDAPGLEIETEVGLADPVLIAAGLAPEPAIAAGRLDGELEALLDLAAGALPGPGAADLAEGADARITPAMQAAVDGLGRDPLAIYNFVHDGFDPEPYYGSKKGSVGAWEEHGGNDADLSSVLIAMLRAAGIPARYEYGTVDLTPAQAMAWTGTTDVYQAGDALATGGIPTMVVDRAADRVVRVEHVWVRAWVPYSNYRGLPRPGSRGAWVRLDPTIQRARIRQAANVRGKVSFDYAGFLAQVGPNTPLQVFEAQLREYAQANAIPCRTLDDFIPARERVPDALSLLPAELPAQIHSNLATFAALPSSMRHTASIELGGVHAALALSEIYGAAMTIRYRGATAADEAAIATAGGIAKIGQPSSIRVAPSLVVDGTERSRGAAVVPGTLQEMAVTVSSPNDAPGLIRHQIRAGSVFAIAFPVGKVPDSVVERRELDHSRAVLAGATGDDLEAARGNRALWRYFWHLGRDWERIFGLEWARVGFGVSEGIAGRVVVSESLYDVPVSIRPGNFVIDVPRLVAGPYSVDGQERERLPAVFELAGHDGSTWEHLIWEETVHAPSISTIRIFQVARQQGQQLRTLTPADAAVVASLPFSDFTKEDVTDALHRGLVVTIPERPVTWASYPSSEAYVLKDPRTGAADFRIKGLYSGGESDGPGVPNGPSCPSCSGANGPASSTVSMSDGAMYFAETDLVVPARGIPVTFGRRYSSGSPYGGRLGAGWQHSFEVRLLAEPDGSVTYVNDELHAVRFTRGDDGSLVTPAGYDQKLVALADGHRLVFKDGLEYRFGTDGQLTAIQDPNDHLVLLRYDAGRLTSVIDASARPVLTFEYDSGLLSAVRDLAGRAVLFGHDDGDLVAVTDVLNHVQRYGYDSAHRMTSKTDRNGKVTQEFYDAEGRWVGSSDPLSNGRAVSYDMVNRRALHEDKTGATTLYDYNERGNPVAVTDALGNRRELGWDGAHHKLWERDARGNETRYTYDANGNLETRTDALHSVTRYTYDASGRVRTVTANDKLVAENTYDARGNLETATDALGKVTRYGYTADGLPETITQPGDAVTRLAYNSDGTVKTITDGEGGATTLGYDAYGHIQSIKNLLSERTITADAGGRVVSMTDALQKPTSFEYDDEGNRTAVVDADLRRTEFGYDGLNRLETVTDAKGATSRTEYDPEGRVLSRTDALGRKTRHRYDAIGRLVGTTDAAGSTTVQAYCADVSGQACALVDPLGNYSELEFDPLGRPTDTVDANGTRTTERYDAFGRRDQSVVAGRVTQFDYDDAGRLWKVIDALQGVTEYGYDDRGNRTSVKDANGHVTLFGYDKANRLVSERNPIQPEGSGVRYEYDAAGNRRFKTDGKERRTEYQYDANRRLKAVLFADGTRYDYAYDARGNRTLEKSPTHERGLDYDEVGRLVRVEDRTLGRVIEYGYDAAGQRRRMAADSGETVQYAWDAVGRLLETVDPQGEATRFSYDAAGRRTGATYGNGTRATYGYDAAGQVLSIAYLDRMGAVQTAFGYGYDATGNRTRKTFEDGTQESYGYDALNRLTSAKYGESREIGYGYDAVGNRASLLDTGRGTVTRWATGASASSTYPGASPQGAVGQPDAQGCGGYNGNAWVAGPDDSTPGGHEQILELAYASAERAGGVRIHEALQGRFVKRVELVEEGGTAHAVYDGVDTTVCGDWLTVRFPLTAYKVKKVRVHTAATANEGIDAVGLEVPGGETYAYNAFNQLLSVSPSDGGAPTSFGYDGNGNQTTKTDASGVTTYVYNDDNRLVGISGPAGMSNAFEYDANGLRTKKTDSSGTTRYLLDGLRVIAQYAPDGARQAWYTQSLARIDEVLNVVNDGGKQWYQADALGSVYGLTSASGTLVGHQGYDVFGAPMPAPAGPAGQPFGFTGREHELESGLVYARARYLNPAVGRWDRPDPLVLGIPPDGRTTLADVVLGAGTELHLYSYVNALPTRARDPSGLIPAGALVLAMMPIGLQWDSIVIGVTQYLISRAEDAALISPTNVADCDACMVAVANARRIIWTGWGKPRDALLSVRMREYLLFYGIGEMVGVDDVLKLAGHKQAIEQGQAQLKGAVVAIMASCKNPQLQDLGWWYLYIATLRMP